MIEERKHEELTSIAGVKVAADGIGDPAPCCWIAAAAVHPLQFA